MRSRRARWIELALVGSVALASLPRFARAQLAPTGDHYGGRLSDTGFGMATGAGYSTSVPLSLPPARGGLPIPLSVSYGGHKFGAAGVGWDVPLYYVMDDTSFNHRRPALKSDVDPWPRERVSVVLPSGRVEMVRKGTGFIGRSNGAQLTMKRNADGSWSLFDGQGRTWTFLQDPKLQGSGMWLLDSVSGAGSSKVQLGYAINGVFWNGSGEPATTIDLTSVRYDQAPTALGCYKYEVDLVYDAPALVPLTLALVGESVIGRVDKLLYVNVTSRAGCTATPLKMRSYALSYQLDLDTKLPQLSTVKVTGRAGTSEASTPLPVATYSYGTATYNGSGSSVLRYVPTQTIPLPTGMDDPSNMGHNGSLSSSVFTPPSATLTTVSTGSMQSLVDVTGDGRADLVLKHNGQPYIARNVAGSNGTTLLGPAIQPLYDATLTHGAFEERSSTFGRYVTSQVTDDVNIDYVWRQAIDVNGDGRLDLVDASEEAGHWVVYLDTPDTTGAGVKWVRRSFNIAQLYKRFTDRHLVVYGGYLPLSRRLTTHPYAKWACYKGNPISTTPMVKVSDGNCAFPQNAPQTLPEVTAVEWELKDINGDGYPDMVLNSSPTTFVDVGVQYNDYRLSPTAGNTTYYYGADQFSVIPTGDPDPNDPTKRLPNRVDVAFNVRGIFMANDQTGGDFDMFSAPTPLIQSTSCGVAQWTDAMGAIDVQSVSCDITDVNGDGLADRVQTDYPATVAWLGTGSRFSGVSLTLPDSLPLSRQTSPQPTYCKQYPSGKFISTLQTGLRDLTGDGIPDFIYHDSNNAWWAYIGTGVGFNPAIPIVGTFALSDQSESCDGSASNTVDGLFDLDGDGKPETVTLGSGAIQVYQLLGADTVHTPEAGRLTRIDNGYGAITGIQYRSAKDDPIMLHQVPYPEIVASSVDITGTLGLGGTLTTTRYAYGGAIMTWDQRLDAYTLPSYTRTIEMRTVSAAGDPKLMAEALITDAYPPTPWNQSVDPYSSKDDRFGRSLRVGRTSDVTVLGGGLGTDPWALLSVNIYGDARRMGGTHYDYGSREIDELDQQQTEDADDFCYDMIDPYDFDAVGQGATAGSFDPCSAHGFLYTKVTDSWRGFAAPPATENVESKVQVLNVDDYDRPTSVYYINDVHRSDDDYCIDTTFATPTTTDTHVLGAAATRKVYDCSKGSTNAVYAYDTFEYDKLPLYSVGSGLLTGHNIERHATDSGAIIANLYRDYDVSYDAGANPSQIVRTREDGTKRTATLAYDAFDVAPTRSTIAGSGTATLTSYFTRDAYSLAVIEERDPDNTLRGTRFDGFDRPVMRTIRPLNGTLTALSSLTYLGFAGGDPLGRRVAVKQFTDPVALGAVATAPGRTSTTYFDEIDRERVAQVALGADYGNETLVVGARTYDGLGRVAFIADPYPASQDPTTAYGTTRYFSVEGTPYLFIHGRGPQAVNSTPDPTLERYPTLYRHSFDSNQESLSAQLADSLTNPSPQAGVLRAEISSAIGRVLFRSTWQNGTRLEHEQLNSDRVGHTVGVIRYQDPVGATLPVQRTSSYDSFGNLVYLKEPAGAPQTRIYSNFGELKEIDWTPIAPEVKHSLIRKYDALGRLVHAEEQNGGVIDPDTTYDYGYDTAASPTTAVTPTNVLGRLAVAKAPTGAQYFSYDLYGGLNAQVFTDESASYYIERDTFHADGTRASLELDLPDNGYIAERVDYGYDSGGRMRSMLYSDGTSTQSLFTAGTVDPFGRLRKASFANTTYVANYADTGRRLFSDATISSPSGTRILAVSSYDPVARELSRTEMGATAWTTTTSSYDAIGRLATSVKTDAMANPPTLANWSYGYDALGNLNGLNDYVGNKDVATLYGTVDRDQICRLNYGGTFGTACNVTHDSFGNVALEGTRTGQRKLAYYNAGGVKRIDDTSGGSVTMKYDPFGATQELDLAAGGETRSDRRYGTHIYHRYQLSGLQKANYLARQFAGPGVSISRRGAGGPWVIAFQEARGARFSTDEGGLFVQDAAYEPFGETTSSGAMAGNPEYSPEQWNGGDALGAIGLVHVGARLYDPVIGRFLSRDPLLMSRTAATSNPYAFANNDPVGHSDRSGLCTEGDQSCNVPFIPIFGGTGNGGQHDQGEVKWPQRARQLLHNAGLPEPSEGTHEGAGEGKEGEEGDETGEAIDHTMTLFAIIDNEELHSMTLTVMRRAANLNDVYQFSKAAKLAVTEGGWRNGLRVDAAIIKLGLSTFGGKAGVMAGDMTERSGILLAHVANSVVFGPSPWDLLSEQRLEAYGESQEALREAKLAERAQQREDLEYQHTMLDQQHQKQEAGEADDYENGLLYGPSCTGDGAASELRDTGQGFILGD